MSIDIRIRILDFAEFVKDTRSDGVDLRDEFEEFIIREMFQCEFTICQMWPQLEVGTVEPCNEDRSCGGRHGRNLEQHDRSSK